MVIGMSRISVTSVGSADAPVDDSEASSDCARVEAAIFARALDAPSGIT
jgi:hypothetical protein